MHTTDLIGRLLSALDGASPTRFVDVVEHFLHEPFGARPSAGLLIDYDLTTLTPLHGAAPTSFVAVVEHFLHESFGARRSDVLLIDYGLTMLTPLPREGSP